MQCPYLAIIHQILLAVPDKFKALRTKKSIFGIRLRLQIVTKAEDISVSLCAHQSQLPNL